MGSFPSLNTLDLSFNNFTETVTTTTQGFPYFKSLEHLVMDRTRIALNTSFLQIISESMPSLKYLSLSDSTLGTNSSRILDQGLCLLVHLQELYIDNNDLRGSLPWCLANMTSLRILDVFANQLTGSISSSPLVHLTSIEELYLSNNHLRIPISLEPLFNHSRLKIFHTYNKKINAEIIESHSLTTPNFQLQSPRCLPFMEMILDISDNNISGRLPSCFHYLSIEQVHLSKNILHGQLKEGTFSNCSSLVTLDLSYNCINGSIPKWVDGLSQLSHLILSHNNLEGEVSVQLCKLNQLQLLDLSNNNLHDHIPPCFDNTKLHESYNNSFSPDEQFEISFFIEGPQGSEKKQIHEIFEFTTKNIAYIYQGKVLSLLSGLDLSCNKLISHIPPQIGNLTRIETLNLSHNNLTGSIPSTFSNLKHVESLDLSNNKLNGKIPHQLVELKTLAIFSVAYNNLSGEIPEWTAQFATFNESSYEGNTFLCGLPMPICISPATMPEASIGNERDDNLIDMDSFFITFTT
ncbi:hypothetical protein CUMW_211780, partial [Citrus unshiu]